MKKQNDIKIFEDKKVRTLWDAAQEKWYLSINAIRFSIRGQGFVFQYIDGQKLILGPVLENSGCCCTFALGENTEGL